MTGAGFVVALAVVIASHRYQPEGMSSLGGKALRSLHGSGFAAIAILVSLFLRGRLTGWWRIGAAFLTCSAMAVIAELSQIPGPRNAEFADLVVDGTGILAGLGLVAAFDAGVAFGASHWPRRLVAVAAVAALAYVTVPTLWFTAALIERNSNVPVLLSFESPLERELYAGMETPPPVPIPAPDHWPDAEGHVGHGTASGRWGTMLAMAPYPDWRDFDAVSFVVASASEKPVDVGVMLRADKKNYYRRFEAGAEPQRVRIAFDDIRARRPDFDFSRVSTFVISAAEPGEPYEVLFDDFRLEVQDSR